MRTLWTPLAFGLAAWVLLAGCSKDAQEGMDAKPVNTGPVDGKVLYIRSCQSCHGPTGKGNGPRSGMLRSKMPDFTSTAWQGSRTDAQLMGLIMEGKGSMPAFKYRYQEREIEALITVVRAYGAAPTPE